MGFVCPLGAEAERKEKYSLVYGPKTDALESIYSGSRGENVAAKEKGCVVEDGQ